MSRATGRAQSRGAIRATRRTSRGWQPLDDRPFGSRLRLRRYKFPNGLRVAIVVDRSAPIVSYQTWFRVGSRHERPGKTGLAHLFEHLMFNETKKRGYGEFDRLVESVGAESNAATWTDWTYYYENTPKRELPLIVELESDRMSNLVLRKKQVESEKEVVANERRYRVDDDVEGFAFEQLFALAFKKHPYRWPTIGWMQDIQGFTTKDCLAFYRTYYAPNNATIVMVGDVVENDALSLIQHHYGHLRAARLPRDKAPKEPAQRRERTAQLKFATPTEKLLVGYRAPAIGNPDAAALTIANEVLVGGKSSRLFEKLCLEREIATDVRASVSPFRDPGLYEFWVSLREGHKATDALKLLDAELKRVIKDGVTPAELEKTKNRLELSFLHALETAPGKAEQIGFYETVLGDGRAVFDMLDAYRSVTAADVQRVAGKTLKTSQRTRVTVKPKGAKR